MPGRSHTLARVAPALACAATLLVATGTGGAATSSTVVGATVPSATTIGMGSCPNAAPNTEFSNVTPLSNTVTTLDCTVTFGSSNDSSQIRMAQVDSGRDAMWRPTTGAPDLSFAGDGTANGLGLEGYAIERYPGGGFIALGEDTGGSGWEFDAVRISETGATTWDVYRPITGSTDSMAFGGTVDSAGRVLLVGHASDTNNNVAIMRLEPDGDLDPTFNAAGTPGWWTIADAGDERFYAVVVQPSGRIVAAGWDPTAGTSILRGFTPAGVPDTTFGTSGIVTLDDSAGTEAVFDMEVLDDGGLLLAGMGTVGASDDLFVKRLDVNGGVVTGYGAGGIRWIDANHTGAAWAQHPVQLWRDRFTGTTFVAGTARPGGNDDLMVAKVDSTGTLVPGFGTGAGRAFVDLSGANTDDDGFGVTVTHDSGGVYAMGSVLGTGIPKVVRLDATTGALDPTFGSGGIWTAASGTTNDQYLGKLVTDMDGRVTWLGYNEVHRFATIAIPDYGAGSDWSTATGSFGACLRAIGGGAQVDGTTWSVDADGTPVDGGDCLATVGDAWNDVADTTSVSGANGSKVAMNPGTGNGTISMRFGLRTSSTQAPGRYVAPIVFEVLAPNGP